MGSAIIVAAITYGAGLLMLLNAVEAVVCVGLMVKQKWKANKKRGCVLEETSYRCDRSV